MIRKISHCTLMVNDYDEAIAFYTEKLGFVKRDDMPTPNGGRWVELGFPKDDFFISLAVPSTEEDKNLVGRQAGPYPLFVCMVDDYAATKAALQAKGVAFAADEYDAEWGKGGSAKDLYGNLFHLLQLSESAQKDEQAWEDGQKP